MLAQAWDLLHSAYQQVPGGLHFDSGSALINSTSRWDVVMSNGQLVALAVHKNKAGLKISAFAYNYAFGKEGKAALQRLLTQCLQYSWVEVSEHAEPFVLQQCGGAQLRITNQLASQLLALDVAPDDDGFHYWRTIQGQYKRKIMVGSPILVNALPLAA